MVEQIVAGRQPRELTAQSLLTNAPSYRFLGNRKSGCSALHSELQKLLTSPHRRRDHRRGHASPPQGIGLTPAIKAPPPPQRTQPKSTVAARNREESTELAFVRQSDLSPVHLDNEYACQMRTFSAIRERVWNTEDCPLEFELSVDLVDCIVERCLWQNRFDIMSGSAA